MMIGYVPKMVISVIYYHSSPSVRAKRGTSTLDCEQHLIWEDRADVSYTAQRITGRAVSVVLPTDSFKSCFWHHLSPTLPHLTVFSVCVKMPKRVKNCKPFSSNSKLNLCRNGRVHNLLQNWCMVGFCRFWSVNVLGYLVKSLLTCF